MKINKTEWENYKKIYKDFWKGIIENKLGFIKKDQVMRELADYSFLMEQASTVYCEVANLSKTGYYAETIIGELDNRFWKKAYIKDDIKEMLNSYNDEKDYDSLAEWLKEYFELDNDD